MCIYLQVYYLLEVIICRNCLFPFKTGVSDFSGFELTYLDIPRKYDAGVMTIGYQVDLLQIIPPHQDNFNIYGVCNSSCTSQVSTVYIMYIYVCSELSLICHHFIHHIFPAIISNPVNPLNLLICHNNFHKCIAVD